MDQDSSTTAKLLIQDIKIPYLSILKAMERDQRMIGYLNLRFYLCKMGKISRILRWHYPFTKAVVTTSETGHQTQPTQIPSKAASKT